MNLRNGSIPDDFELKIYDRKASSEIGKVKYKGIRMGLYQHSQICLDTKWYL